MLVLGIDPGTAITGYGLVVRDEPARNVVADSPTGSRPGERVSTGGGASAYRLVECGVIRTRPRDPLAARLREIHDGVAELIARHHPDALAVEDVFYSRNARTTISLGHARGVVLLAGEQAAVVVYAYPPAEIKKAIVGTGAATKEQVQFMVARLLRLRDAPSPSDAADGVAAALTCLMSAHLRRIAGRA